ncbi:MAG: MBL fold metallo-hydrolase [Oscillospiraceae bacterium]|nr:MBL fold metallo-hydrolase [Oscillospiraceae bacterium]
MTVTYLNHSGFFVELDTVCLLFDYWRGHLPEPVPGKALLAFASHSHHDHYNEEIFAYAARWQQAKVVLGNDIRLSARRKEALGITNDDFLRLGPDRDETVLDARIRTLRSTDSGVAFLVTADGRTVYHAGDLNWWVWDGEPEADNAAMTEAFLSEIQKLAGIPIDLAFLTLDARQGPNAPKGFDHCMQTLDIKQAVPMHSFGTYTAHTDLLVNPISLPYRHRIRLMTTPGQTITV